MSKTLVRPARSIWSIPAAWPKAGTTNHTAASPLPIVASVLAAGILVAVTAPWLVHLLRSTGSPLGPTLLPIFYAPMLAALMLRLPLAVAVSVGTPLISQELTGLPPAAVLPSLMLQVACFVIVLRAIRVLPWVVAVPIAYLGGLASASMLAQLVGATAIDVLSTLEAGWPGIVVLAALGLLADRLLRRTTA